MLGWPISKSTSFMRNDQLMEIFRQSNAAPEYEDLLERTPPSANTPTMPLLDLAETTPAATRLRIHARRSPPWIIQPMASDGKRTPSGPWATTRHFAPFARTARRPVYAFPFFPPAISPRSTNIRPSISLREAIVIQLHTRLGPMATHTPLDKKASAARTLLCRPPLSPPLAQMNNLRNSQHALRQGTGRFAVLDCVFSRRPLHCSARHRRALHPKPSRWYKVEQPILLALRSLRQRANRSPSPQWPSPPRSRATSRLTRGWRGRTPRRPLAVEAGDCRRPIHHAAVPHEAWAQEAICPWAWPSKPHAPINPEARRRKSSSKPSDAGPSAKVMSKMGISVVRQLTAAHISLRTVSGLSNEGRRPLLFLREHPTPSAASASPSSKQAIRARCGKAGLPRYRRAQQDDFASHPLQRTTAVTKDPPRLRLDQVFRQSRHWPSRTPGSRKTVRLLQTVTGATRCRRRLSPKPGVAWAAFQRTKAVGKNSQPYCANLLENPLCGFRPYPSRTGRACIKHRANAFIASAMSLGSLSPRSTIRPSHPPPMKHARRALHKHPEEGGEDPSRLPAQHQNRSRRYAPSDFAPLEQQESSRSPRPALVSPAEYLHARPKRSRSRSHKGAKKPGRKADNCPATR